MANFFSLPSCGPEIAIIHNSFFFTNFILKTRNSELNEATKKIVGLQQENQDLLGKISQWENSLFVTGTKDGIYEVVQDLTVPPPNHPNSTQPLEIQSVPINPEGSTQPLIFQSVPFNPQGSTQPGPILSVPINPLGFAQPNEIQSVPSNPQGFTQPNPIQSVPINPPSSTQPGPIQSAPIQPSTSKTSDEVHMEDFQTVHLHQDNDRLCPEKCCPKSSNSSGCKVTKNKEVHCYSAVCRKGDPKKVKRSRKSVQASNETLDVNSNQETDGNSNQVK